MHSSGRIRYWPSMEWISFFCLHVSLSLDWIQTSAYWMKSDRALRIQLAEWKAKSLNLLCGLPSNSHPFQKNTNIHLDFPQTRARAKQVCADCRKMFLWFRSWKYIIGWLYLRKSINKNSLTKPVWSCGCLQKSNETDKSIAGINKYLNSKDLLDNF